LACQGKITPCSYFSSSNNNNDNNNNNNVAISLKEVVAVATAAVRRPLKEKMDLNNEIHK